MSRAAPSVRTREKRSAERLRELHEGLAAVIGEYRPTEAAVEETFVNRDPQSALKLGQARGIALVVPALAGLPVAEYAANLIKKTVTGTGHAEKAQIAHDGENPSARHPTRKARMRPMRWRRRSPMRGCGFGHAIGRLRLFPQAGNRSGP